MIPYSTQSINDSDIKAVVKALRSKCIAQGPAVERFEKALAKKASTKYCVAFNSGTSALHGAYFAIGLKKGDEIIVPALTFSATSNAALYLGAKPVFADVSLDSGLIDIKDVEKKITKRTKAIVSVDYAGRPADMNKLKKIANKYKLVLISDSAHSLGGVYRGKSVGSHADMTMFSFHPVKSITTGEGGVITTNNKEFADRMRMFRSHGITKDAQVMGRKNPPAWYQEMQFLGYNYRMTDIQAALGESQLKRLNSFIVARRKLAKRYHTLLKDVSNLVLPLEDTVYEQSAWHLYPIRFSQSIFHKRDEVFAKLQDAGIGAQVHYIPVYLHPYYKKLGYKKGLCPNTEAFSASTISIPLFPTLSEKKQGYIVKKLKEIVFQYD
jgi:perosamine synthetase